MITLLRQELFDPSISGYSVYTSGSQGNFDYFTGSAAASKIGPQSKLTASSSPSWGYSAKNTATLLQGLSTSNRMTLGQFNVKQGPISASGMICAWYNVWNDNSSQGTQLMDFWPNGGESYTFLQGGITTNFNNGGNLTITNTSMQLSASLQPNRWTWIGLAWYLVGVGDPQTSIVKVLRKQLGEPTASVIGTYKGVAYTGGVGFTASIGFNCNSQNGSMIGRFGCPSVYYIDSASFVSFGNGADAYPSDQVDPPSQPYTWYINQATGNDINDGLSTNSAWQSVAKLNQEINSYQGVFGTWLTASTDAPAQGDKIVIDTTISPLDLYNQGIYINKSGLYLTSAQSASFVLGSTASYAVLKPWQQISNSFWNLVAGRTNTYVYTSSVYLNGITLWENNKWMNTFQGPTTYNSISNSMDTTSGSFWCDSSSSVYVNPFGNTNPQTDSKSYTISRMLYEPYGQLNSTGSAAIEIGTILECHNIIVEQIYATKTATYDNVNGYGTNASYLLTISNTNGLDIIRNCYFSYGGRHNVGILLGNTNINSNITMSNVQSEQDNPFNGNSFVIFSGATFPATNSVLMDGCISLVSQGVVGTSSGSVGGNVLFGHNGSSYNQFNNVTIRNCNFIGGDMFLGQGAWATTNITTTTSSGDIQVVGTASIDRCLCGVPYCGATSSYATVTNCIINPKAYKIGIGNIVNGGVTGFLNIQNCTLDFSSASVQTLGLFNTPIFTYNGGLMIFKNNVFISYPTSPLFGAFISGSLISDYNAYYFSGSTPIASASMGFTNTYPSFSQWQSTGLDINSKNYNSPTGFGINLNTYIPSTGSPLIGAATTPIYNYDITGVTFPIRLTIGAYEYVASGTGSSVIVTATRLGPAASTSGQQTINDVQLTHQQTVNDSVLNETLIFNDPHILALMEELEYLRAKKQLTPLIEGMLNAEISGRANHLMSTCRR